MILKIIEDIVKTHKIIGVFISGGIDSTLLAYLLQDTKRKLNVDVEIKYFCVKRPDDSELHAKRIVNYIDKTFGLKDSDIIFVGTGDGHHSSQVKSGVIEAIQKYEFDLALTAITKNPERLDPPELLPNYEYDRFIDADGSFYNGPKRIKANHKRILDVFWDYSKADTVKLIKDLNLLDIPNITHTCTASKTTRCGICWQCCERAWAFYKNDLIDTGIM